MLPAGSVKKDGDAPDSMAREQSHTGREMGSSDAETLAGGRAPPLPTDKSEKLKP